VGWEKVTCWRTKAAISLKRVKIEEKLLWRDYRKSQTLFRTAPSATPYGLPLPKIGGSQPHPKSAIAIISRTAKATDCKFRWYIHRVHPNTSPRKMLEKMERGRIQGRPDFFEYPYYLRNVLSYELQMWQVYSQGPCKQMPIKNLGEKGT